MSHCCFPRCHDTGKTPLGIYARKSYETYLDRHVEELMTVTKQGLSFYADFFGLGMLAVEPAARGTQYH